MWAGNIVSGKGAELCFQIAGQSRSSVVVGASFGDVGYVHSSIPPESFTRSILINSNQLTYIDPLGLLIHLDPLGLSANQARWVNLPLA